MTIEIGEKTVGMWRIELPQAIGGNVMVHLAHVEEGLPRFRIDVRSRFYVDDITEAHLSQDRRRFWEITTRSSREEAIAKCRKFIETYRHRMGGGESWELMRGGRTVAEFGELLGKMPGMHAGKLLTEEEFAELCEGPLLPEAML
jgi:hypothetical protein